MYKPKDRQTKPLFSELLPFGGQMDETGSVKYFSYI